jgi:probable F420-dependent oxidoreductase
MRVGLSLPQFGGVTGEPAGIRRYIRQAEDLGADSLWVGDRLLAPVDPVVGYGLAGPGPFPEVFRATLDPFALLSFAAPLTTRVRLGTNVINAPYYPAALLARALTAIDVLSEGRLVVGLGSGWSPDEFQAVGVPFSGRGARLEETLDVLDALWTSNPAEHRGTHWTVPATHVELTPVQRPRPPVYLAGFAPAALRRVGRRADGWLPASALPDRPMTAELYAALMDTVREAAVGAGRDPARIRTVMRVNAAAGTALPQIVDHLAALERDLGIDDAFVDLTYLAADTDTLLQLSADLLTLIHKH